MKTIITTILLASCLSIAAQDIEPKDAQQQPVGLDSMRYTLKQRELIQNRTTLEQRIRQEDEKRGVTIPGATPDEQEAANLTQDSLCLALRSQLTDINLQINELSALLAASGDSTQNQAGTTATTNTLPGTNTESVLPDGTTITLPARPTTGTSSTMQRIIQSVRDDR